jgi:spore maturation protein CgeB
VESAEATRALRLLLVHPGASWSTADVYDGLLYGLRYHGAVVIPYRLDTRIEFSHRILNFHWRRKRKDDPALQRPTNADVCYHAGIDAMAMALREQVDVVLVVSAMFLHPDVIVLMKRAGLRVVVLFTESPYDHEKEMRVAALVDGCWTNERSSVAAFRRVNSRVGYLPHAWHPLKHFAADASDLDAVPAHDVVFVGSGFPERVRFFNAVDWTGIDLGIYGAGWTPQTGARWDEQLHPELERTAVRGGIVTNETASALYRRAKVGLNLYRHLATDTETRVYAESLSPRAYELARCGVFHISERRAEVADVFGGRVPTFDTPEQAGELLRGALADDYARALIAKELPACVAEASWVHRARTVIGDLARLLNLVAAA